MAKPVILTGIRSNGELTLGNYLGAILPTIELQRKHAGKYQVNMFVPDLHSFTTPIEHGQLYQNTLDNLTLFVAAGLDIQNTDTFIYRQSYVPAHSELTWILDCFIGMGELERMTQYKSKSRQLYGENVEQYSTELANEPNYAEMKAKQVKIMEEVAYRISVGLFNYPALMAADILLYGAKYIPVGEDQRQHIELTRDVATRMNNKFGELFTIPEDWDKQVAFADRAAGVRIRSLRSPEKKMSKSIEDPAGTILLTDKPDEAAKKVMGATTDNVGVVNMDFEKQPGISNLLQIHALLSGETLDMVAKHYKGQASYGDLKKEVADEVKEFLTDLQDKYMAVDSSALRAKLEQDEVAMRKVANDTLLRVQKAVGLREA